MPVGTCWPHWHSTIEQSWLNVAVGPNCRQHKINNTTTLRTSCCATCRFSPELLGVQASSAFVWLIMEVLVVLLSLYLVTVNTDLTTIDLLAFSGYKYVGCVPFYPCVDISIRGSALCCLFFNHTLKKFFILIWNSVCVTGVCVCGCVSSSGWSLGW